MGNIVPDKVLVATGGYRDKKDLGPDESHISARCFWYDCMQNKWKEMLDMIQTRVDHKCVVMDEKMYIVGGYMA